MFHINNELLLNHKKEGNTDIPDNMDESWGHYTKWSKSNRALRQMLCGLTYMGNLKT